MISRTQGEMLISMDRSDFYSGVTLRLASVRTKSNMSYEVIGKLFNAFYVEVQAIRFIKVTSGPKTVNVANKPCPVAVQKVFNHSCRPQRRLNCSGLFERVVMGPENLQVLPRLWIVTARDSS